MHKDFVTIKQMHGQAFVFVEVLLGHLLHARRNKTVRHVHHCAGIRRNLHEFAPFAAAVARLFGKLTLRGVNRRLSFLDHATWQLIVIPAACRYCRSITNFPFLVMAMTLTQSGYSST